jgi:hypothetical protein
MKLSMYLTNTLKDFAQSRTVNFHCRSQWPHGVRHEPCSSARTLGSWVRIPLETGMSVCVILCVGSGLAAGWSPVQRVLQTVCRLKNWKKRTKVHKGCRARDRQTYANLHDIITSFKYANKPERTSLFSLCSCYIREYTSAVFPVLFWN